MKRAIFLFSALIPIILFAQNWSPIRVNEKMNYQHSDSGYISHTIWVDSSFSVGGDTIFYLNRIVKDVPGNPEIALRNQPQFLLETMTKDIFGMYSFINPEHYMIITNGTVGTNWTFDQSNGIGATISELIYEEIFGVMDSVKVINLSNGNEIRLSQNFGILKFPDFENGGNYNLVGIQGTEYGESVPGFLEIFDFEVGDIFQHTGSGYIADQWVYHYHWTKKVQITSKELFIDSVKYGFSGIYRSISWGKNLIIDTISGSVTYIDSTTHPANNFPNEIYVLPNSWSGYGTDRVFTRTLIYPNEVTNVITKEYGMLEDPTFLQLYQDDLFFELDDSCDTLYRYDQIDMISLPAGLKKVIYANTLGEVLNREGFFEYEDHKSLQGYVKDGDTVGTVTPDSVLLAVGISDLTTDKTKISVYPNPADQYLNIQFSTEDNSAAYKIEIRNMLGELLLKKENLQKTERLDVSELNAGIYFYSILLDNKVYRTDKLVVY